MAEPMTGPKTGPVAEPVAATRTPEPAVRRSSWSRLWGTPFQRGLALALGVHVGVRAIGLLVLAVMSANTDHDLMDRLRAWDGGWYIRIATEGYAPTLNLDDTQDQSTGTLAFFPVYPMLMRLLTWLTPITPAAAGVLLSELASAAAAVGLYILVRRIWGTTPAILTVLLWSAQPMAVVLSMVYTEALFTAFVVWSLVELRREAWLSAGVIALLAGLTRPTGVGIGFAVASWAAVCWWQRRGHRPDPINWRMVVGSALALLGTPLWWLIGGLRVGRLDGWFAVQERFWGSQWDWGAKVGDTAWSLLTQNTRFADDGALVLGICSALLVVAVVLLVECGLIRMWWPMFAYAAVLLVLTIGSAGYVNSKPRFLIPIFPLLIPLALALGRARPVTRVVAGVAIAVFSAWFGGYMLTIWNYTI